MTVTGRRRRSCAPIALERRREGDGITAELMVPEMVRQGSGAVDDETSTSCAGRSHALGRLCLTRLPAPRSVACGCTVAQMAKGAAGGLPPLAAAFGAAEIDKAVLDALCRRRTSVLSRHARAICRDSHAGVAPDLAAPTHAAFCARRGRSPRTAVRVHRRHRIDDVADAGGVDRALRCRRSSSSSAAIRDGHRAARRIVYRAASTADYRVTLDGNEQFGNVERLVRVVDAPRHGSGARRLASGCSIIEQPLPRPHARSIVRPLARRCRSSSTRPTTLRRVPARAALGYRGVSSKSCKGLYKSLLNACARGAWSAAAIFLRHGGGLPRRRASPCSRTRPSSRFSASPHVERNGHHLRRRLRRHAARRQTHSSRRIRTSTSRCRAVRGAACVNGRHDLATAIAGLQPGFACARSPARGRMRRPPSQLHPRSSHRDRPASWHHHERRHRPDGHQPASDPLDRSRSARRVASRLRMATASCPIRS